MITTILTQVLLWSIVLGFLWLSSKFGGTKAHKDLFDV